jgi:hypothetical protein
MLKRFPHLLVLGVMLLASMSQIRCSSEADPIPKEHELAYQAKLQSYADVLKHGMTRVEVETYLHSKGIKFVQMCCIDEKGAFADLVLVGKETHAWYCSERNAYIAFQFAMTEPRPHTQVIELEADSDELTKITVYYWNEGCM